MKRAELLRRIAALGAMFVREGGNHTMYKNPRTNKPLLVPRHKEVKGDLARQIVRDAGK